MRNFCLLLLVVVFASCQTCTGVGSFTVTRTTATSVVEGSNSPLMDLLPPTVVPPLELNFDLQAELARQDAKGAKAVYLNGLVLQITDDAIESADDTDNFDFLSRIEFYVESTDPDSELSRVRIASLDPVPEGKTELVLDTDDDVDLKPYAQEGIVLTTSGRGTVPSDDVSVEGVVTIEVETL